MTNDYTQITWPEVRKGDVLFHENGDRLTVESASKQKLRAVGQIDWQWRWREIGFTPYRRKPEMPTEPGAYLDKEGEVVLHCTGDDCGDWFDGVFWRSPGEMEHRAPFTRLVPMPTREQVYKAVDGAEPWLSETYAWPIADAVMALLNGEGEQ